jgi:hypothetical protein
MPLINLKSDLTSCKYGHDRPGGSDSGQPFIISYSNGDIEVNTSARNPLALVGVNSIPAVPNFTTLLGRKKIGQFILDAVNGDDFIRGGGIGVLQASINDTFRISAFLASQPKGLIFLAKQVGLQLSNPKLEVKKGVAGGLSNAFTPGGLLGTVTGGILGSTRIYNLGINTVAQVGVNAFGVHFNRHGLLPTQNDNTKYESVVSFNNEGIGSPNNRLVGLMNRFSLNTPNSFTSVPNISNLRRLNRSARRDNRILPRANRNANILQIANNLNIDSFQYNVIRGEPASSLIVDPFGDAASSLAQISRAKRELFIGNYLSGPGSVYGIGRTLLKRYNFTNTSFDNLANPIYGGDSLVNGNIPIAFYKNPLSNYNNILTNSNDSTKRIGYFNESRNNTLVVVLSTKRFGTDWSKAFRENNVGGDQQGFTGQDPINLISTFPNINSKKYYSKITIGGKEYNIEDFVPFRINALNGDDPNKSTLMVFRSYITQFSDSVDATWNPTKYAGRGEDFYIYNGFTRKINIGFKVAALSKEELVPMFRKLNYLMRNLMPDYKDSLMRGPLVQLTVGNYVAHQDGILNSLTYTIPNDSPWEIEIDDVDEALGRENIILPHIIEVNLTFTPIGAIGDVAGTNISAQKGNDDSSAPFFIGQPLVGNYGNDYIYGKGEITPTTVN